MNAKKAVNYVGKVLMLLAFAFIIKKLYSYRDTLASCFSGAMLVKMIVCTLLYGALIFTLPGIYKALLNMTTGKHFNHARMSGIYCKSNLYKYLPGNVMQYVGRNQLAVEENLSHVDVATATLLDISTTVFGALIATVLFAFGYALEYLQKSSELVRSAAMFILAACFLLFMVIVIALIVKRDLAKKYLSKYFHLVTKKNISIYLICLVYNFIVFIGFSLLFMWTLYACGGSLEAKQWPAAIGLFSFSYLLGFITPGVPGGIGIREAVLSYFFAGWIDPGTIVTAALVYRVATIFGDMESYGLSRLWGYMDRKKKAKNGSK